MSADEQFYRGFQTFEHAAATQLTRLQSSTDEANLLHEIISQQRALNEQAASLPAYDVRRYQSTLDGFTESLRRAKIESKPKSKFSFKTKSTQPKSDVKHANDAPPVRDEPPVPEPESPGSFVLSGPLQEFNEISVETHDHLKSAKTVLLTSLCETSIDLTRFDEYVSVTLRSLTKCIITAGKSNTALFIENCHDCEITGEARQFRIHGCSSCVIQYVCKTGRPVIEDCHKMRFANLSKQEPTMVDDFSDISVNPPRNWSVLQGFA